MGFCTAKDVENALKIQREQDLRGEKHRLLGILMAEEGILSTEQLIRVLKAYPPVPAAPPGRAEG